MKAIILAAGYATRLYPLTENFPKPLLKIGSKTIVDYLVEKIEEVEDIDEIFIVSNHKFINEFEKWRNEYTGKVPIKILDDGSTSNENRLGAIRDIYLVLEQEDIDEDILVVAGDNILEFNMNDFYGKFKEKGDLIAVYDIGDLEKVRKRHGVVILEGDSVVDFQEKPEEPKSTMKSICCYMFRPEVRDLLKEYLEGNNPDAPGFFIQWLVGRRELYAFNFDEKVYDIGNIESYREANRIFSG